jgi:Plavaka transposase
MTKARNRPSNDAWMLIAYLPIVEFLDDDKIRTTLTNRLWHQCIRIVVSTLIEPGINGRHICDSVGHVRHCYPLVAGHLGDLPEQCLVTIASRATSPVAIVSSSQFGDPTPRPPRTREWILQQVDACCALVDATNVKAYQKVAKEKGLNGVHVPYWIDLPKYQPELVVCPDILHGVVRFWRDHPLAWSRKLVNAKEYDKRLTSLQYIPGYRHFKSGISHLSQWTGREDRELQRVHIAIIADCPKINPTVLRNQRAFHDFLYLVQYNFHSDATLDYMRGALETFHATKNEYIKNGARSLAHFKIPKMFELQRYEEFIRLKGSAPQYSTEITESLHRPLVKELYHLTNHKEFIFQMCRRLSRSERLGFHKEFSTWCQEQDRQSQLQKLYQAYTPGYRRRAMDLHPPISEETQENEQRIPVRMRFEASRLWLALKPHHSKQSVLAVAAQYGLPDLPEKLQHFLRANLQGDPHGQEESMDVQFIDVWRKLRIHISDVQDEDAHSQDHSVEAIPPSESLPYGRCHCVLVHDTNEAEATGIAGLSCTHILRC